MGIQSANLSSAGSHLEFIPTLASINAHYVPRPEGGWDEPYELDMFTSRGFQQITLGTRVLRSDVAVVSLLALAHEVCATDSP